MVRGILLMNFPKDYGGQRWERKIFVRRNLWETKTGPGVLAVRK
jgi:hypothetical protein